MCKIRYIYREENQVINDQQIKVGSKDFDLLNRPYYLVREDKKGEIVYSLAYLKEDELDLKISENMFSLTYGKRTGRFKELVIKTDENERIKNECWENFQKFFNENIDKSIDNEHISSTFELIRKIYFEDYTIINNVTKENY